VTKHLFTATGRVGVEFIIRETTLNGTLLMQIRSHVIGGNRQLLRVDTGFLRLLTF